MSSLSLPLAVLLFAQWPLRDCAQSWSRPANDVAQIVFALYAAEAVTAASCGRTHLSSGFNASADLPPKRWRSWALLACTAPWVLFMFWANWPLLTNAVIGIERFAETNTQAIFYSNQP